MYVHSFFETILFFGRQNTAFRGHESMALLNSRNYLSFYDSTAGSVLLLAFLVVSISMQAHRAEIN